MSDARNGHRHGLWQRRGNFAFGRALRARIAADQGEHDTAGSLAREALGYAYQTDFPDVHATAHEALAHVPTAAGHPHDARAELERALQLWESYGYNAEAERTRARLTKPRSPRRAADSQAPRRLVARSEPPCPARPLAAILVFLAGYATWTNVHPYTLQAVWAVLTDLDAYPRWNPFIVSARGQIKAGATLVNQMHDATGATTFTPTIQVVKPVRELRWIGRVGPGFIFDGQHTITITPLGPGRVLLTQREDFTGVAVLFYEHRLHADTLPQFRAMKAALARQATRAS